MFACRWWEPTVQELTRRQLRISSGSTVFVPLCSFLRWQHQVSLSWSLFILPWYVYLCFKSASLAAVVKAAYDTATLVSHVRALSCCGIVHRNLRCQCDMQSGFSHCRHWVSVFRSLRFSGEVRPSNQPFSTRAWPSAPGDKGKIRFLWWTFTMQDLPAWNRVCVCVSPASSS